jgi:hypothetical protein
MISDFRILGIEETDDVSLIKSAFRRRAKELHPDLSTNEDAIERHDLFTQVCKAYRRLLDRATKPEPAARGGKAPALSGNEVAPHADQAYVFYRQGMRLFMSIHPPQWNIDAGGLLNTRIAGQDGEQEIIQGKVMGLVKLFPRAYYYFSIVVHEYPESEWAFDASGKMGVIEERIGMYRKIIQSFTSWNVDRAFGA